LIIAERELPKTTERLSEEQVPLLMKALHEEISQVRNFIHTNHLYRHEEV